MSRKTYIKLEELFRKDYPDRCAVCNQEIQRSRSNKRYCSSHCKKVAYATQKFFDWNKIKDEIRERDDWTCQRCGKYENKSSEYLSGSELHVDHIRPVSKGGSQFDKENLQLLCRDCNLEKGNSCESKSIDEFYD